MGTSSGTRSAACSSSSAIGSGRSAPGSHTAWLERGVSDRHDLPPAARSAGEPYRATDARADGPGGPRAGLRSAVAMRPPNSPAPGDEAQQPLSDQMPHPVSVITPASPPPPAARRAPEQITVLDYPHPVPPRRSLTEAEHELPILAGAARALAVGQLEPSSRRRN